MINQSVGVYSVFGLHMRQLFRVANKPTVASQEPIWTRCFICSTVTKSKFMVTDGLMSYDPKVGLIKVNVTLNSYKR